MSLNRRTVMKSLALGGAAAMAQATESDSNQQEQDKIKTDKECVMEAGMTDAEAKCWALTAEAAGAFFALPTLHTEDAKEVSAAIHVIQNKLLSRPTYRKYLEIAKANHELKTKKKK